MPGFAEALRARWARAPALGHRVDVDGSRVPEVTYAAVLNGEHLCACLEYVDDDHRVALQGLAESDSAATPATRTLDWATPATVATDTNPGRDLPWSGSVDLLPHAAWIASQGRTRLVLVSPQGELHVPKFAPSPGLVNGDSPTRADVSSDGQWLFDLHHDGQVTVTAARVASAAHCVAVRVQDDELLVGFTCPTRPRCAQLNSNEGAPIAELSLWEDEGCYWLRVGEPDVAVAPGRVVVVSLLDEHVDGSDELPLRRTHADLHRPGASVVMPEIAADAGRGHAALKVTYRHDGRLMIRRRNAPTETSDRT